VLFDLGLVTHSGVPGRVGCWIVLREAGGFRRRIFQSGPIESAALITQLLGGRTREQTLHFGFTDFVRYIGGSVRGATVDRFDTTANAYHASIRIDVSGEDLLVKATPGDAVMVAVISGAPIYIAESVLDVTGGEGEFRGNSGG
jgi:bifunctional DNase/RNase